MSGEYFDDDELINDYMEEDLEPPPDYDDAFMEELEQQHASGTKTATETNTNEQHPTHNSVEPPASATTNTQPDEPPESSMPLQESTAMSEEWKESRDTKDLYKFERFQGKYEWRKTPETSVNTMTANTWKHSTLVNGLLGKETGTARSTAPEVQLVEFLNCKKTKRLGIPKFKAKQYLPKEGVDSVAMTLADGSRIHVTRKQKVNHKELLSAGSTGNILGISMTELMRRSDAIRRKAERRKSIRKTESSAVEMDTEPSSTTTENEPDSESMHDEEEEASVSPESSNHDPQNHQLWVDKHAPTIFSHLLSDERTNREVLRALRAWDPYVFHREPPPRPTIVQQFQQQQQEQKKDKQPKNDRSETPNNPKDTRPDESNRVLLLSGPPGVGKTTLAHIVARHAGYRPLEVNSSDERSASVLKERVVRAMESSTLNLKSNDDNLMGRPNCLILDEIDGADAKGAVAALVDIIRAEMPTSKKAKNNTYLRRPIIFICNHKYAPALRPLLPYARQFDVGPPSATRLVARLRSVLSEENMSLMGGSALLHQLVAGAGGDIRSCLYTLQFASARSREIARTKKDITRRDASVVDISQALSSALGATGNGLKDERNDVAGTITAVFRKLKISRLDDKVSLNKNAGVDRVLRFVESFGDNSKTLDCLFTNLLRVSYVDPTLDRCFAAHEWLSSADIYRSHKTSVASNNHAEHHTMQRFHIPSAAAAVHLLCRVETKADLLFTTRQMVDSRYQLESNTGLIHKFVEGLAPKSRAGAVGSNVVTETIPYSLWMLSAGEGSCSLNRAVSSIGILNNNERLAFDAHVATLRALGLTYVPEETNPQSFYGSGDSNARLRLEPQIDRVVQFEEMSVKRRKEIPSVLKELLAHNAALEAMRERETVAMNTSDGGDSTNAGETTDAPTSGSLFKKNQVSASKPPGNRLIKTKHKMYDKTEADPPAKRPKTTAAGSNFLGIGAAKARAAKSARKAALVGFDRSKKLKLSNTGSGVEFKKVIRFKFSRGFTQAVRTPCRLEDLV